MVFPPKHFVVELLTGNRNNRRSRYVRVASLIFPHALHNTTPPSPPLLLSSTQPAHIISIFGPRDSNLITDDLSLRSPKNYSFLQAGHHIAYFTTFFMEHLAAQNPGKLALVHYFLGLVITDALVDPALPWWFFRYGELLVRWLAVEGDECGERVLGNTVVGDGAYRVNWNGEVIPQGEKLEKLTEEGWGKKVVEHTFKSFEEIVAGKKFIE